MDSLSQKVTLGSPVRLQTSSRRFDVAAFTSDQGSIPCDGHAKMSFSCAFPCGRLPQQKDRNSRWRAAIFLLPERNIHFGSLRGAELPESVLQCLTVYALRI